MKTYLDWSSYENAGMGDAYADIPEHGGDFAKAVAVCINSRHCENKHKGVMCPSFRISDEAALSTGGRVRLLKAALNSSEPLSALAGEQLADSMDLCVACKGCKRECENEVDMAMLKIEYLAQRQQQTGVPLRSRLFANLPELLGKRAWLKSLIRLRNRSGLLTKLADSWLGISALRRLPEAVAAQKFKSLPPGQHNKDKTAVALFIDTFTQHFAPENAEAAIEVLQTAGYQVHVVQAEDPDKQSLCCGRTRLAHGLVEEAKQSAHEVLGALAPYVEQQLPILGLEPACLLAIRDDYKFLGLGEQADKTAALAVLFEEFIAREHAAKRLELPLQAIKEFDAPVLVHGHCHQKAVGAMKSMRKVLKLIPEFKFELIESSCCGMAGSFGLEKEHQQDSLAMAELSLLPTIRQQPQANIVANGFSCRHQIKEGSQRDAMHIAVLLRKALQPAL